LHYQAYLDHLSACTNAEAVLFLTISILGQWWILLSFY